MQAVCRDEIFKEQTLKFNFTIYLDSISEVDSCHIITLTFTDMFFITTKRRFFHSALEIGAMYGVRITIKIQIVSLLVSEDSVSLKISFHLPKSKMVEIGESPFESGVLKLFEQCQKNHYIKKMLKKKITTDFIQQ